MVGNRVARRRRRWRIKVERYNGKPMFAVYQPGQRFFPVAYTSSIPEAMHVIRGKLAFQARAH